MGCVIPNHLGDCLVRVRDGEWPREVGMLHAEFMEFSCILHAKEFLFYFTWPPYLTLLRVYCRVSRFNILPAVWSNIFLFQTM